MQSLWVGKCILREGTATARPLSPLPSETGHRALLQALLQRRCCPGCPLVDDGSTWVKSTHPFLKQSPASSRAVSVFQSLEAEGGATVRGPVTLTRGVPTARPSAPSLFPGPVVRAWAPASVLGVPCDPREPHPRSEGGQVLTCPSRRTWAESGQPGPPALWRAPRLCTLPRERDGSQKAPGRRC